MKFITGKAVAAITALDAGGTLATIASYCHSSSKAISFRWGIPEESIRSGSSIIYFQIEVATSYEWVGLGIGSSMSDSDISVIYQDGNGNVTLSTRTGIGHVIPQYSERSDVQLLAGSGVINRKMIANIRCGECDRLELGGTNSWIAAWREGNSLSSTDPRANIQKHNSKTSFSVNFAEATISSDSNPFVGSLSNDTSGDCNSDSSSDFGSNSSEGGDHTLAYSHGIVVVFLIGYPIGAVLMAVLGRWLVHAGWQILGFLGMWSGFGLGYTRSWTAQRVSG